MGSGGSSKCELMLRESAKFVVILALLPKSRGACVLIIALPGFPVVHV